MRKVKIVCAYCGSQNVECKAYADWDVEQQKFTVADVIQDSWYCHDCSPAPIDWGSTIIKEIEV